MGQTTGRSTAFDLFKKTPDDNTLTQDKYFYILTVHDLFGLVSSIHFSFELDLTANVPISS